MKDPFALLAVEENSILPKPTVPTPPSATRKWRIAVAALVGVVLILIVGLLWVVRSRVLAETEAGDYDALVEIEGLSSGVTTGDELAASVSVTNKGVGEITKSFLLVQADGFNLQSSLSLSSLKEGEVGYLRKLNEDEKDYFTSQEDNGLYWYLGDLDLKQTRSQQIKGVATGTLGANAKIEAKLFVPKTKKYLCGIHWCEKVVGATQIGYGSDQVQLTGQEPTVNLVAGYNYLTLPYVLTLQATKDFLTSLKDKWAYSYKTETAEYLNLLTGDNAEVLKPGRGFWLYAASDAKYNLPETKVANNINEAFSIPLYIGWNQIGNPYPTAIYLSSEKITVQEVGDDGTPSGTLYSLKSALDNKILSQFYVISRKTFTDSSGEQNDLAKLIEYKQLSLESILQPFIGATVQATKRVNLVFPGREITTPCALMSASEKAQLDKWLDANGLNQYGDPVGTAYSGGSPLKAGETECDYIVRQHSERPWGGQES